ncbi:MAG: glucosaminidase domain-containing protein [Bacteroidales bacterium]|nr:glucosaminidase domain-containing protein [Bacteroidales bacterium]
MLQSQPIKDIVSSVLIGCIILFISPLISSCVSNQSSKEQAEKSLDSLNIPLDSLDVGPASGNNKSIPASELGNSSSFPKSQKIIHSDLPDFSSFKNTLTKKKAFFNFLKPFVQNENNRILSKRRFIEEQYKMFLQNDSLSSSNQKELIRLGERYRCTHLSISNDSLYLELLLKVDAIPIELALTQAALESSWGTSYFARIANNLFGRWCFTPGCGIVPRARKAGDTHEVAKYKSVSESVQSYMHLLNSHPFFEELRKQRASGKSSDNLTYAVNLAKGLTAYSARKNAYVHEVQNMIHANRKLFENKSIVSDSTLELSTKPISLRRFN